MTTENDVLIEVVEVQAVGDRVIIAGQLLNGEVARGMVLESDSNARYTVTGVGFVSPEFYSAGRRGLTLAPLDVNDLAAGSMLHQVQETIPSE